MDAHLFYTRAEHGSRPVRLANLDPSSFMAELLAPDLVTPVARFDSPSALLATLMGRPARGMSVRTYFRLDARPAIEIVPPGGSVLDLFAPPLIVPNSGLTVARDARPRARAKRRRMEALTVAPPVEPVLGIDLRARGHEVRKILFAGFGARIMRSGYDPEDVLQEIYRGILARNVGKCPFDPRKSSFGHYVHMVCECILNNYHRKESRRREVEQIGVPAPAALKEEAEATGGQVDAAVVADRIVARGVRMEHQDEPEDTEAAALERLQRHLERKVREGMALDPLALRIAQMLADGHNRRDIAKALDVPQARVLAAIAALRQGAADWL